MGELVFEPQKLYNPVEWKKLQDMIKSKYTIESDKAMFDAILNGATIEEALNLLETPEETNTQDEEIVFF